MKVLMLSNDKKMLEAGSQVARRTLALGEQLERLIIVLPSTEDQREYDLSAKVRVVTAGGATKLTQFIALVKTSYAYAKHLNPSIITVQDPFAIGLAGAFVSLLRKTPLQVQVHTDYINTAYIYESPRRFFEFVVSFAVLLRARCARTVTNRIQKRLAQFRDIPISVLPIFIPRNSWRAYDRPRDMPKGDSVLTVSRLAPEKRILRIISAMKDVQAQLVIIGDGTEKKRLERMVARLGIQDRTTFLGWKDTIQPYLQHADVFVQASRYEGYGLALAEAALLGCPIVSTNVGIAGDVLKKGEDLLIADGSVESFRRNIMDSLKNRKAAQERAEHAMHIMEKHSITEEEYVSAYIASLRVCTE